MGTKKDKGLQRPNINLKKTLRFSDVFRELKKGALGTNGLIYLRAQCG